MDTYDLSDGRVIGCSVLEITTFLTRRSQDPTSRDPLLINSEAFIQLLRELHKLCSGSSAMVELLWVPQKVENQLFRSKIRLFFVLRAIESNKELAISRIELIQRAIEAALTSKKFVTELRPLNDINFIELLSSIKSESLFSIAKSEHIDAHSGSAYPYYYCNIIPSDNYDNFDSLLTLLSQYDECCVAFQLFSTSLTAEENYYISESTAELNKIT
ncbi:hypothetical protein [Candidatus Clostridium stratigraminis]